jgi:hypothetical protein
MKAIGFMIPTKSVDLEEITKFIYANADLVTVTQRKFAERVKPFCGGVLAVVKNAIDYNLPCWNVPKLPPPRKRMTRVGWAGGIHHEEDVKEFAGSSSLSKWESWKRKSTLGFLRRPSSKDENGNPKEDWQHEVWKNYKKILLSGFSKAQPQLADL